MFSQPPLPSFPTGLSITRMVKSHMEQGAGCKQRLLRQPQTGGCLGWCSGCSLNLGPLQLLPAWTTGQREAQHGDSERSGRLWCRGSGAGGPHGQQQQTEPGVSPRHQCGCHSFVTQPPGRGRGVKPALTQGVFLHWKFSMLHDSCSAQQRESAVLAVKSSFLVLRNFSSYHQYFPSDFYYDHYSEYH